MSESQTTAHHIDFDHWSKLAKSDPDYFEQLRSRTLAACIERSSDAHQERLRRLQWRIDRVRENASNPMAACVKISDMMWNTFHQLGKVYRNLDDNQNGNVTSKLPVAKVLPFPPTETQ